MVPTKDARAEALLKIASYLDDPQRRAKDLIDLRSPMQQYERDSERVFSGPVFEAELPDIEFAGSFLLGLDLGTIATDADVSLIESFASRMLNAEGSTVEPPFTDYDWAARDALRFRQQLSAFVKGLRGRRSSA